MLTNSLIPFAYDRGKSMAGVATVVGFCLAMLNSKPASDASPDRLDHSASPNRVIWRPALAERDGASLP